MNQIENLILNSQRKENQSLFNQNLFNFIQEKNHNDSASTFYNSNAENTSIQDEISPKKKNQEDSQNQSLGTGCKKTQSTRQNSNNGTPSIAQRKFSDTIGNNQTQKKPKSAPNLESTYKNTFSQSKNQEKQQQKNICAIISKSQIKNQIGTQKYIQSKQKINTVNQNNQKKQMATQTQKKQIRKQSIQTVQEIKQEVNKRISEYLQVRPAIYKWMRKTAMITYMSLQTFALSMKYMDEYHISHGNEYNPSTFASIAYTMTVIASKMMNKKVLIPRLIAPNVGMTKQKMEQIQMHLINLMNYKVYFNTFVKKYQIYAQKWEQICKINNFHCLMIFQQNQDSFKRLYKLLRQIQQLAKSKDQITNREFLQIFIRVFYPYCKSHNICEQKFNQILHYVFNIQNTYENEIIEQDCQKFKRIVIKQINLIVQIEQSQQMLEIIKQCFKLRLNQRYSQHYSIFLNSTFKINL